MTTIFFGTLRAAPGAAPVSCSAIVVCHVAGSSAGQVFGHVAGHVAGRGASPFAARRRVTNP
ncbi:hypothetical protein [Methylobacterium nonmethylotrophicum]|uniref:Uncharacterized protein n=1 Tax=Methylobacterium nonmethylotrophicum TaxID=1141884 RepID=A0A4Z0NWY2_9HYPH|nr:hypothetical protein [Methylobacterium nonmethylotrophicum]TGE02359.1 hypothetical protein EU555_00840 [Methylobacterium nonmethylotrophicum]